MPRRSVQREPTEWEIQMRELIELDEKQRTQIMERDTICVRWHRQRHGLPEPHHEPHIVFTRGQPAEPMSVNTVDNQVVVIVPDDMYRTFLQRMYLLTILALFLTFIPSMCLCVTKTNVAPVLYLPYYVWLLCAVVMILFSATCPPMRRSSPGNWIFATFIVVMLTIVAAYCSHMLNWILLFIGITLSCIVVVTCLSLGVHMPLNFLPGGLISVIVLLLVGFALAINLFLSGVTYDPRYIFGSAALGFILALAELLIHAQYVHGRRSTLPFVTMAFCAVTIYVIFLIIIVCLYIFYCYNHHGCNNYQSISF